jgi:hypothetical protein
MHTARGSRATARRSGSPWTGVRAGIPFLDSICAGTGEALGVVRLPEAVAAAEQGCLLHPALLDGCMPGLRGSRRSDGR